VKSAFIVEVRFDNERRWRAHQHSYSLPSALKTATSLSELRAEDATPKHVFPNVRLRYRGLTLIRWKLGWKA
jgi:hypothetical protein